jgi:hypothetical protein
LGSVAQLLEVLFQSLLETWPEKDLEIPRMFVDHNEEEEAINELIAIGWQNGLGFTLKCAKQIDDIVEIMKIKGLLWVNRLRAHCTNRITIYLLQKYGKYVQRMTAVVYHLIDPLPAAVSS